MSIEVVIGVDGGGTRTRVMVATVAGQMLAYAETGPASPKHTTNGEANVRQAIDDVLARANCSPANVVALAAGLSGLDNPTDQQWAEQWTAVPGLMCSRVHVNDAVVAHIGAFRSQPGILAIAGTGSNVYAVTDTGQHVRNGDFAHYARAAAVHLAIDSVLRILVGDADAGDRAFVDQVLNYWQAADINALRAQGQQGFVADRLERLAQLSAMAPLVTAAATHGSPLAQAVCDRAAEALVFGVRLLGTCFGYSPVPVAVEGSVGRSPYMLQTIDHHLQQHSTPAYTLVGPTHLPVVGAVLLALQQVGKMNVHIKIDGV